MTDLDPYGAVAAEFRRIADDLETLAGSGLPAPYVSLDIQPGGSRNPADPTIVDRVDQVVAALHIGPAATREMSSGTFHHGTPSLTRRGPISLDVYDRVPDPAARERDAEIERLRAELAALHDAATARAAVPTPRGELPLVLIADEVAALDFDRARKVDV